MSVCAVEFSQTRLEETCKRHHIRRLAIFGSSLRDDFGPDSDVDVLVEFEAGHTPGWEIVDIGDELSDVFGGRYVDIVNPKYLLPSIKKRVLTSAVVLYDPVGGEE